MEVPTRDIQHTTRTENMASQGPTANILILVGCFLSVQLQCSIINPKWLISNPDFTPSIYIAKGYVQIRIMTHHAHPTQL